MKIKVVFRSTFRLLVRKESGKKDQVTKMVDRDFALQER